MPKADSPVATIIANCNETMERHEELVDDEYAQYPDAHTCERCGQQWPCDAYSNARDLREAVVALQWYGKGNHKPIVRYTRNQHETVVGAEDGRIARSTLAAIAERGEAKE